MAHFLRGNGVKEMTRRYQDFRQFVATARDLGDTASLVRLARRFAQAAREEMTRATAVAPEVSVADGSFATLIASVQQCAPHALGSRVVPVSHLVPGCWKKAQHRRRSCSIERPELYGARRQPSLD